MYDTLVTSGDECDVDEVAPKGRSLSMHPNVAISIREACAVAKSVTGVEAALYAVKYTEAVSAGATPSIAVRAAAAHVLDHRDEIGCLEEELVARHARREKR